MRVYGLQAFVDTSISTAVLRDGDGMLGTANADSLPWGEGGSEFYPVWC